MVLMPAGRRTRKAARGGQRNWRPKKLGGGGAYGDTDYDEYRHRYRRDRRGRGARRCPRGYTHKLLGQKRKWVGGLDKIVKHGHYTRKCYRKKTRRTRRR